MQIKRKLIYIYCFLMGLLGFSIFGQYIQLNVLHLPFYFVEIVFIPAILINRSSILECFKKMNYSTAYLIVIILASMFINIVSTGHLFSAIVAYRAIIYLLFFISYFRKHNNNVPLNMIFVIVVGAICGEAIYVLLLSTAQVTSSINVVAIAMLIWIPYIQGRYLLSCITATITIFLAINTGFRIGIIVVVFTILCMFVYSVVNINSNQNKLFKRKVKTVLFFGALFLGVIYFVNNLEEIINKIAAAMGMDSFAVFRVTTRLESLLSFDFTTSQDTGRLEMFDILKQKIWSVAPMGLDGFVEGGLNYSYYVDIPPTYLIDIFGSVVTIIIFVYFSLKFVAGFKTKKAENEVITLAMWLLPLFGFLFLTNGTFIINVGQAIMTGAVLGYVTRKNTFSKNKEAENIMINRTESYV